ncbi:hypothetical protein EJ04DRAFT_579419 [Polyplosphaeria fusca]|uniref:Uncharacterized protein n=1 Tax=Polyplosphaeria fusca TaxID=682080 RepID=A0A9P4QU67_9PLEO|nr:hypothetical protein EJ04DRAFT_579419 [Polyplosphaeria fusca]
MAKNEPFSSSSLEAPPPYILASSNHPSVHPLIADESLSLIMQDSKSYCFVASTAAPDRCLYRLSQPIFTGHAKLIGAEKYTYKIKDSEPPVYEEHEHVEDIEQSKTQPLSMLDVQDSRGPRMTFKRTHIYDIEPPISKALGATIRIKGMSTTRNDNFSEVCLERMPLKTSWKVVRGKHGEEGGQWKLEAGGSLLKKAKARNDHLWQWRDSKGDVIAVEIELTAEEREGVLGAGKDRARLDICKPITGKDLDLLVTAWAARIAFEAAEAVREPMTWSKFKRIAETGKGRGGTPFGMAPSAAR